MRINGIEIDNFLRIGRLRIDLEPTVIHMVCGHNEAGKTSLQEAMRFCLLGETERVSLKRDYKMMVKEGAKSGEVRLIMDEGQVIARDVATGRGTADEYGNVPESLEYLLDATRYAWLTDKQRRAFMFNLMNVKIKADDVKRRLMEDRGIAEAKVDLIMPMLKAGFEAAHSFAKDKATEGRGEWKATTGETYGAKKGATWACDDAGVDPAEHSAALAEQAAAKTAYEEAAEKYGADKAVKRMAQGQMFPCPGCGETICMDNNHPTHPIRILTEEEKKMGPADEALVKSQEREIDEGERQVLDAARERLDKAEAVCAEIRVKKERAKDAEAVTAQAGEIHKQIEQWVAAAEALAPSGIPSELVSEKIKPLNNRLRETAVMTGWPQVSVTPDMQILVDNRPYALQSESSQWRAQAAIAEAISVLSGVGILVLDRVDVLDLKNRAALVKWMLKVGGEHLNVLLFGTFKEPPKVPKSITVHWLESGKLQEAA
jgi:hypothetical protein